jgi:hypothetical protein
MYDPLLFTLPTESEINETIALILKKLDDHRQNCSDKGLELGYETALTILANGIHDRAEIPMASLQVSTSYKIAHMAVDYLNGACDRDTLIGRNPENDSNEIRA